MPAIGGARGVVGSAGRSFSSLTIPGQTYVPGTVNTRRATQTFGDASTFFGAITAYQDTCCRMGFQLPVLPTRIRFRWKNWCASAVYGTASQAGPVAITGIWMGALPVNQSQWSGAFAATPTLVAPAQVIDTSVTEYVSPWVNTSAIPGFLADIAMGVSFGINTAATGPAGVNTPVNAGSNTSIFTNGAGCSLAANAGAAAVNPAGGTLSNSVFLGDLRMEYEYIGPNQISFHIGDSVTSGVSSNQSGSTQACATVGVAGPYNRWPEKAAAKMGTLAINAAITGTNTSGSLLGPFQNILGNAYARFDLASTIPDFACISLGTNDCGYTGIGGPYTQFTPVSTYQTNMLAIVAACQSLGIRRVYATTVPPQGQTAGPLTANLTAGVSTAVTVAGPHPSPATAWALPTGSTTVNQVVAITAPNFTGTQTLTLTSTAGFSTSGGFVAIGTLGVLSYAGVTGLTLTGCTYINGAGSTIAGVTTCVATYQAGIELGGQANPVTEVFYPSAVSVTASVATLTIAGSQKVAFAHTQGAIVMNQAENSRQNYNAWLRAGCAGIDGVFDLSSVVEGLTYEGSGGAAGVDFASGATYSQIHPYYGGVLSTDLHPSGPAWHSAVAQAFAEFIIGA